MSISIPGSDALYGPITPLTVPGSSALSTPSNQAPSPSATASQDPYRQAYDQIETSTNAYLLQSLGSGPSAILPEYTQGSSASAFASLETTLAAIEPGLAQGLYGGGTGINTLA